MDRKKLAEEFRRILVAVGRVQTSPDKWQEEFRNLANVVRDEWPPEGCLAAEWHAPTDLLQEGFRSWIDAKLVSISIGSASHTDITQDLDSWRDVFGSHITKYLPYVFETGIAASIINSTPLVTLKPGQTIDEYLDEMEDDE
jgi:hypothetical protein